MKSRVALVAVGHGDARPTPREVLLDRLNKARALTLWQPWAGLVAAGHKTIETRSWSTSYRGLLVIAAAKRRPRRVDVQPTDGPSAGDLADLFGAALAVCELVDVRPLRPEDAGPGSASRLPVELVEGRFAWVLERIRLIPPVPIVGRQGLYRPDRACHDAVARVLREDRNR